ncbi:MAG: hypothetical protein OXJ52_05725 [Oligoflexia bacterium]|nr:hypothetical protein [Oligoflexia bacterium]
MSIFDNLAVISFLLAVFLIFFSNFLYKKLITSLEDLQQLKRFKEETFELIKNLETRIYEYRIITERTEQNQKDLKEHFERLGDSFRTLKQTATELQSAHQTKKAMLDFMKG